MKNLRYPLFLFRTGILSFLLIFFANTLTFSQQKQIADKKASVSIDTAKGANIENIIGYGTQKEHEITSSVTTVRSEQFNRGNINDPVQLIQGKVAGLDISKPGSDPNGSYYLRLRSLNTLCANSQPLVVVDGMSEASLNNVDPNDIESFTVLKDGAAASIYGARGSNGVILVTTKHGRQGTSVIDYNVYATAEKVARNTPMMNSAEWRALSEETGLGTDFGQNTDWFKQIEQTAFSQVHNLSMSGGTDKTTYRASINYHQGEGIEINTGYRQLNGRINLSQKALHDRLILDMNLAGTERESQYGFAEAFRYAALFNPTAPVTSSDPSYDQYGGYFQQVLFDYYNPVSILKLNTNEGKNRIYNVSLKGTYQILKGLNIDAFYSIQNSGNLGGQYLNKHDYWGGMNRNGLATRSYDNSFSRLFESTVHYMGDVTSALNINAVGGYSYQDFSYEGFYAQGGDFITDDFSYNNLSAALDFKNGKGTVTSYKNSNKLIAFFGRVNLNLNNIYFLSASARYEGSSRFGANNKWGLFPAISGGANLANLINVSFIDNLKVRADYGITGMQPFENYMSLLRLGPQGNYYYYGSFRPYYGAVSNPNPDLKWEKKGEFDAGLDFSFFRNRLSGSFDLYTSTASDLLFQYYVPVPPNLYSEAWMNIGKIKSSGLELTLKWNIIKKSDFSYSITLTRSSNFKNTLVSLSGTYNGTSLQYGIQDLGDLGSPGGCCAPLIRSEEGKPLGQLVAFVDQGIDETGRIILADQNKDGMISFYDLAIVGNGLPKSQLGFGNTVTYKNLDLNIFFRGVFGHDLLNSYRAFYEVPGYITSYNLPETAANMRNSVTGAFLQYPVLTNRHIENASFIALDNINLGYSFKLPESSQFSKIRLYLAGNSLFYITRYKGSDPNPRYVDSEGWGTLNSQLVPGIDRRNTWARTRSVTFGANVVF